MQQITVFIVNLINVILKRKRKSLFKIFFCFIIKNFMKDMESYINYISLYHILKLQLIK